MEQTQGPKPCSWLKLNTASRCAAGHYCPISRSSPARSASCDVICCRVGLMSVADSLRLSCLSSSSELSTTARTAWHTSQEQQQGGCVISVTASSSPLLDDQNPAMVEGGRLVGTVLHMPGSPSPSLKLLLGAQPLLLHSLGGNNTCSR